MEREGGTNSIKPSQPADSYGKNKAKAKSRKAWRVGSVVGVLKVQTKVKIPEASPSLCPRAGSSGEP